MNSPRPRPGEPQFDIFLSYSNKNLDEAKVIAEKLEECGLRTFFARKSILAGRPWREELEKALSSCRTVVVLIGRKGLGNWQEKEVSVAMDLAIKRKKEQSFFLIPVLLKGAKPPELFLGQYVWVDLVDPEAMEFLIASIRGQRTNERQEERSREIQEELKQHVWGKLAKYRKLQLASALSLLFLALAVF